MANILVDSDKNLINLLSKIEEHTEMLIHNFIASALEQMMGEVIEDTNTQN